VKPIISPISKHEDWRKPWNERWMSNLTDMNLVRPAAPISNAAYPHGIGQNASTTTDLTGLAKILPYDREVPAGMIRNNAAATLAGCTGDGGVDLALSQRLAASQNTSACNVRQPTEMYVPVGPESVLLAEFNMVASSILRLSQ